MDEITPEQLSRSIDANFATPEFERNDEGARKEIQDEINEQLAWSSNLKTDTFTRKLVNEALEEKEKNSEVDWRQ